MTNLSTNYQCPACTGPLHYEAGSGKLACEYCGSIFEVSEIESRIEQAQQQGDDGRSADTASNQHTMWEEDAICGYQCDSCGAELVCDSSTAATQCPYCGNPTVLAGRLRGVLRPDYVIAFQYTRAQAIDALKQHYKGKLLLPGAFRDQAHLEEIKGIYVPFWLFDGKAEGTATFEATRQTVTRTSKEEIVTTQYYQVERTGALCFEKIPADGSSKMPDAYMDAIAPFHYDQMVPFSQAYLPGFLADKYDIAAEDCVSRATAQAKGSLVDALGASVTGYTTVVPSGNQISFACTNTGYALLPVWLLTTRWHGKSYLFAVNGQTGRTVGELPVSKGRLLALIVGLGTVLSVLLYWIIQWVS